MLQKGTSCLAGVQQPDSFPTIAAEKDVWKSFMKLQERLFDAVLVRCESVRNELVHAKKHGNNNPVLKLKGEGRSFGSSSSCLLKPLGNHVNSLINLSGQVD